MNEFTNFDAHDFRERNGIRVFSSAGDWCAISLTDLELPFIVPVGICGKGVSRRS